MPAQSRPSSQTFFCRGASVNCTKTVLGQTIGAAGALESAVITLTLARRRAKGCVDSDDPIADLNCRRRSADAVVDFALTHSFGFGEQNAGLVLRHPLA